MDIKLLAFILMISAAALFACDQQGGGQQTGETGTDQETQQGRGYYGAEDMDHMDQPGGRDTLGGQGLEPDQQEDQRFSSDQQEQGIGDEQQGRENPNQPPQQ